MSNPHYDRAKSRLHNGTNNEVARAQAEATLALAYEQRTANLIALLTAGRIELHDGSIGISDTRLMELQHEVLGRLNDQ
ncbi:hypothetical protein PP637_gp85 [Arthrobacter phage Persistence]|uniref:Uncharacterized protein n=1 Tax=Arthrobacter phage Persistence TaxID=2836007 RepID=A0A8F3E1K4_9CAUD|nr:hypothetical protein PP637_gp85 [Arthrobacter phage Persistence]QWY79713.1 hypothetical protein SEA_PERSISTENCE_85 [Arthrobacter phage Persistence]